MLVGRRDSINACVAPPPGEVVGFRGLVGHSPVSQSNHTTTSNTLQYACIASDFAARRIACGLAVQLQHFSMPPAPPPYPNQKPRSQRNRHAPEHPRNTNLPSLTHFRPLHGTPPGEAESGTPLEVGMSLGSATRAPDSDSGQIQGPCAGFKEAPVPWCKLQITRNLVGGTKFEEGVLGPDQIGPGGGGRVV